MFILLGKKQIPYYDVWFYRNKKETQAKRPKTIKKAQYSISRTGGKKSTQ